MSRAFVYALLVLPMLWVQPDAGAAIDKAVLYHDSLINPAGDWMPAAEGQKISAYLQGKGYTVLDADGVRAFMEKHIAAKDTSVIVYAADVPTDTVIDDAGITDPEVAAGSLFNQYLKAGGKVVWLADWPAYYVQKEDGSRSNPADVGAAALLDFWPAQWTYADLATPPVFTQEGAAWGLTKTWLSLRPTDPNEVGLILGTENAQNYAAMPWVKQYTGRPGAGLTYIYDRALAAGEITDEDLAQIQRVADYFPAGEVSIGGSISGTATNPAGEPLDKQVIRLRAPGINATVKTDSAGKYSFPVPAGTFTVALGSEAVASAHATTVAVADGESKTVDLKQSDTRSLTSASGVKWETKIPASEIPSKGPTPKPTDDPKTIPTASGFVDATVPGNWETLSSADNVYGWLRAKITVDDAWVGKDLVLGGWTLVDRDWTYWNGEMIGATDLAGIMRQYVIPGRLVLKENDLAILGFNAAGEGGIIATAPQLYPARPNGQISGRLLDSGGKPIANMAVVIDGNGEFGQQVVPVKTDDEGRYIVSGLGAGTYLVANQGGVWGTPRVAKSVTVKAGETTAGDLTVAVPAVQSFRYQDLLDANLPGWAFLQTRFEDAPLFGTVNADGQQLAPDEQVMKQEFMQKWCDAGLETTGASALVPGADWLPDWDLVPGTAGPAGRAGDPNGIPDFTYWVQSLRFKTTGDMAKATRFAITDFNVNDNFEQMCVNGTKLYGRPDPGFLDWFTNRQFEVPDGLIKTDGSDNIVTIVGYSLGGNAGHSSDFGGPRLVGVIGAAPPMSGDINGDGKINVQDATLSLRIAVGLLTPTDVQKEAGDVNNDGKWNIQDTTLILQVAVGNKPASDLK